MIALYAIGGARAATAPMAKATKGGTQSLSSSTSWVTVSFDTEEFDSDAFHDLSTNNERLTVPTGLGGVYAVSAAADFQGNVSNGRGARVVKNGSAVVAQAVSRAPNDSPAWEHVENLSAPVTLAAGDYLTLEVRQASGSTLNLNPLGVTHLAAVRLDTDLGGGGGASALDDLSDVTIVSPIDGAVLKYDEADSQWKVATDDVGSGGSSGPVTLSAGDRERLDLAWWGVWALVGLALLALIAPAMYRLLDVRHGMGGRFERG